MEPNASDDEEAEHGRREVKRMLDPKLPSAEEVKAHKITHLPYRNWCPHCVKGRGKEMDHTRRDPDEQDGVSEYHLDYCFPGDEHGNKLTVLVAIEKHTKMKKAMVVPMKGSTGHFAARKVLDLIRECGDKDSTVIVKTDQEPAIKFLVDDVCMNRTGAKTIVEEAPVRSKGSNGVVEKAVQAVEQYLRTTKSQLDERYGVKIATGHPILTWLCEYCTHLLNRLEVSKDGKTAYERCKGKKAKVLGFEFGETVLWKKRPPATRLQKMNSQWELGIFLGVRRESGELIVASQVDQNIKYTRTARRVPEEERWSMKNLDWVRAVPWNLGEDDSEADGENPEFDYTHGPGTRLTEGEKEAIRAQEKPQIIHRAHLRKSDFEKYGFTDRCGGCSAILRGLNGQPHTDQCRRRMEKHLADDDRVRNAKARLEERRRKRDKEETEGNTKLRKIEDEAFKEEDPNKLEDLFKQYMEEYKMEKLRNIEDDAMKEEDPHKLEDLFKQYAEEYKAEKGIEYGKRRKLQEGEEEGMEDEENMGDDMEGGIDLVSGERCGEYAWDDVNDSELPIEAVKEARKEEMEHMKNNTFKVVKRSEAFEKTGKKPLSTKWVDTDKSHGVGELKVRSRWVARDFHCKGERDREDLFCATPPLEMLRFLLSRQATARADGRQRKTMFIDVKKAHLVPKCDEDVYVELPEEAGVKDDECGKLLHWLYGCRRAGQAWEDHYSKKLIDAGFLRGTASPVVFYHPGRDVWGVVHGDDFVFTGLDDDLDYVLKVLQNCYEIKNRGRLGSDKGDVQEIDILGRTVSMHDWGISWAADPRHKQMITDYFGMNGDTKPLSKNGYKEEVHGEGEPDKELDGTEAKNYRALAARVNYMAQDNPCVQFSAKEICRAMSKPRLSDFQRLKKLARFLMGMREVRWKYPWQSEAEGRNIEIYVDSDWAGCAETRRSTSGGAILVGRRALKTWSTTQPVVALSSGETEYYAMVDGATRGMGFKHTVDELGMETMVPRLATDSSAAKSFSSRRGLGKMRHIAVKELWLQNAVKNGEVVLKKIDGAKNIADQLTKFLDASALRRGAEGLGVEFWHSTLDGRDPSGRVRGGV